MLVTWECTDHAPQECKLADITYFPFNIAVNVF